MERKSAGRRFIAATSGAIFMKLGRAPATLMILSMKSRAATLSSEQLLNQIFSGEIEMAGNVVDDSGERTDANRMMTRDCYMMLTALNGCQSKMAASLSGYFVAQGFEGFG